MNLHIMPDEKVISRTIDLFEEVLPCQNIYIILLNKGQSVPKYVSKEGDSIKKVVYGTKDYWSAVGNVQSYDNIIVHQLSLTAVDFVNKIEHPRITWIAWGADLYGGFLKQRGYKLYYDEKTVLSLENKRTPWYWKVVLTFVSHYNYTKRVKSLSKISSICAAKGDYNLLKLYYPNETVNIKLMDFFYYPLDVIIPQGIQGQEILGNNIIVGNSASSYGNHVEVLSLLSKMNLGDRIVQVPISYGNPIFADYIEKTGKCLLKKSFEAKKDYMPLEEYTKFLMGASTFIYGNYRQEATGNIVVALYLGSAVFLHPLNPLLNDLREMGCVLFSTEELENRIDYKLTKDERSLNRNIMIQTYNKERLLSLIKENWCH